MFFFKHTSPSLVYFFKILSPEFNLCRLFIYAISIKFMLLINSFLNPFHVVDVCFYWSWYFSDKWERFTCELHWLWQFFWSETKLRTEFRRSRSQMFVKVGIFENFANFIGKHLYWSLFSKNSSKWKINLSRTLSQDQYSRWSWFLVRLCKMMISPGFFLFFLNFDFWSC